MTPFYIYGSGGFGREAMQLFGESIENDGLELAGIVDDSPAMLNQSVHGVPVIGGLGELQKVVESKPQVAVFIALGNPAVASKIIAQLEDFAEASGCQLTFPNLISKAASFQSETVQLGRGNFIAAGARITVDIQLGDFNLINLNTVVAHDCVLGDFNQINPSAVVNGSVSIGSRAVIGAGAILMPRISIGDDVVVTLGSVVGMPIDPGCTVVGNPARVVRRPPQE